MTTADAQTPGRIRETYEEYDLDDARVAVIADPEAPFAWIQSDVTCPIDP